MLPEVLLHMSTNNNMHKYRLLSLSLYTYTYIYVCVCVCACVYNAYNIPILLIHTFYSQHFNVSDDGPEERSLHGVVVHGAGHQLSQVCAVWGGQLALGLVKSLLLLSTDTHPK